MLVRFYKRFNSMVVSMGLGVFLLVVTTIAISAGYYFIVRGIGSAQVTSEVSDELVQKGTALFRERGCADCHYIDKTEAKIGPGLKDLFQKHTLPMSGWPATEESVKKQLKAPFRGMPPFADLTEEDIKALLAFLKTL